MDTFCPASARSGSVSRTVSRRPVRVDHMLNNTISNKKITRKSDIIVPTDSIIICRIVKFGSFSWLVSVTVISPNEQDSPI